MDVTRKNFAQIIPVIETKLGECDFVSIDCEFTGLFTVITNDFLDTHEEYYLKARKNVGQFQIIQMGLSLFKMVKDSEFDCDSYNFYIFPRECSILGRQSKERYFLSQASSLAFLVDNDFDFNKLIKEGISYLNLTQAKMVTEKVQERNTDAPIHVTCENDKTFVKDTMKLIIDFAKDKDQTELVLPSANAFRRRLIYEAVDNSEYKNQIDLQPNFLDKSKITVKKSTPEDKKERERLYLLEMVGFTEIIKLIIKSKKPLVGHNLYLDLLYIFNTFIDPLPECYPEFKSCFHSLFPTVYDTRYISSEGILGNLIPNNCLSKLYQTTIDHPFLKSVVNLKNGQEGDKDTRLHEAGYDSYITGYSFINLIRYLYAQEFTKVTNMFSNDILDKYANKIGIAKCLDLKYMTLDKDDISLVRNHVFHLTFPKDWKASNIHSLFNDYGGLCNITFIDDVSAFCVLKDSSCASQVVEKLICKSSSASIKLKLYADFVEQNPENASKESKRSKLNTSDGEMRPTSPPISKKIKKDDPTDIQKQLLSSIKKMSKSKQNDDLFEVPAWTESK